MAANTITTTNTYAKFIGPNIYQARDVLTYLQPGYYFSRAWKNHTWDGKIRLMGVTGKFPAGLTPWLIGRLTTEGIDIELIDNRPDPLPVDPVLAELSLSGIEMREYQTEAIENALRDERGVLFHPTGAGKTEVMIQLALRIGRPCLVLVHRKDLMYQTAKRFIGALELHGEGVVGLIGDGLWQPRHITIASFQTLYKRLKEKAGIETWLREEIGQVHVDEAHHLPAQSYERVMANLWAARWRYGYSATPYKSEGDMEAFFKVSSWLGSTVHQVEAQKLADEGYLVPVDVFMVKLPQQKVRWGRYSTAVELGIINHETRNKYITTLARRLDESKSGAVAILVDRLEHGKKLAATLGCLFLAGAQSGERRQQVYDELRSGERNLIVLSRIADEGLDVPTIAYLILAGGGKAAHLTVQRIGRGMRVSEGKQNLFAFDFLDTGKWLEKHAQARWETYKSQPAYTCRQVDFSEVIGA